MRVRVDRSRCQGHTLCAMIAPETFELDDVDGHATAASGDVPTQEQDRVLEAAGSCPEQAISVMFEQFISGRAAHARRQER